jgi:hypothetical protein
MLIKTTEINLTRPSIDRGGDIGKQLIPSTHDRRPTTDDRSCGRAHVNPH